MSDLKTIETMLKDGAFDARLARLYTDIPAARERYLHLAALYRAQYGEGKDIRFFSAPGRTEVCGNHTDHNHGKVIAAAINLDAVACAEKTDNGVISVKSEKYPGDFIDISVLTPQDKERDKSAALVRGVAARFVQLGCKLEGFDAYCMDKSTGVTNYIVYKNLADALAAAKDGNSVTLMSDVTAADVLVPAGVTLNLYGRTLTANAVNATATGAQIKDEKYSKNAGGKLICDNVTFNKDNVAAPIYYEGAYHFQKFKVAEKTEDNVYKFYISNEASEVLLDEVWADGYANTGLELEVYVTWTENGEAKAKAFKVSDELAKAYIAGWETKMLVLTITSDLSNITDLKCAARVVVA